MRITVRENASSRGFYDRYEAATEEWPVPALFGGTLPAKSHGESPGESLLQMLLSLERDGMGELGRRAEIEDETGHLHGWTNVHVSREARERRPKAGKGDEGAAASGDGPEGSGSDDGDGATEGSEG